MSQSDTTARPVPPARPAGNRKNGSWNTGHLRGVLDGSSPPEQAREADRRGLSMVNYGAMEAAVAANALLPLLNLLDPKTTEGASKIDVVISLLEAIAASQLRMEKMLSTLVSPRGRSS